MGTDNIFSVITIGLNVLLLIIITLFTISTIPSIKGLKNFTLKSRLELQHHKAVRQRLEEIKKWQYANPGKLLRLEDWKFLQDLDLYKNKDAP